MSSKINVSLILCLLSAVFAVGCNDSAKEEQKLAELRQMREYNERRFNDLQSHLSVISQQIEERPAAQTSVSLQPDPYGVQITEISPAGQQMSRRQEIASLSQPVPQPRRTTTATKPSSSRATSSNVIRIPALSVRDVQRALANAGFNPGSVDGKMGPKTQQAIKQFQTAEGLKADGVVGPQTWNRLSPHLSGGAAF